MDDIASWSAFLILISPYLLQFARTKSLKYETYKNTWIYSFFVLLGVLVYMILFAFSRVYVEEYLNNSYIAMAFILLPPAGYCIFEVFFQTNEILDRRDRVRFSVVIVMLSPTFAIFLVALFTYREKKKARKLKLAQITWATEKETFLKDFTNQSLRLQNKRSEQSFLEVKVREFLDLYPDAVLYRAPTNAREFEFICANWMQLWGERDAVATQSSGDGGLDVVSKHFGAQVKFFANSPVGRPDIQALYGAATGAGLQPAFFAYSSGYTDEALVWAKTVGVACFTFVPNGNTFMFQADTEEAAELSLREEGWTYSDWQEWSALEQKFNDYQQEFATYELPLWLKSNANRTFKI